jgi:hypothetical protein
MTVAETAEINNDLYVAIFTRITTKSDPQFLLLEKLTIEAFLPNVNFLDTHHTLALLSVPAEKPFAFCDSSQHERRVVDRF